MASLQKCSQKDRNIYVQVLCRIDGEQKSASFEDLVSAMKFRALADKFGPAKSLETLGVDPECSATTVAEWLQHHIDNCTGLRKTTWRT